MSENEPPVTEVLVVVVEIPGPENVYDLILLPAPAVHLSTLIVSLFLFCINTLFPPISTGSNVIVPTVTSSNDGLMTSKDLEKLNEIGIEEIW